MIRTEGLCYHYPGAAALQYADVEVAQGGVLLLSGASGSGKSTWLALVAGLVPATKGELMVAGQNLRDLERLTSDAWRAKTIGFLPQRLHLSAALSVQKNLAFAQWAAGVPEDPARIARVLTALGVAELGRRLPAQLSGGQAQRVALARAVLLQPQVILADEPTASLDDAAAADAVAVLVHTARAHTATLVIASHDARITPLLDHENIGQKALKRLHLLNS
ncbi:MAG: ATP-binding cassette domain-containing protein [Rhodoferax sp.]|uniref:ABC transporter ATP-binding protein n=1 Tax=Rhodoferax sp. TaxID=50421 RepID=UPI001B5ECD8F|nr:ATP-binding cassette domain-containing protein [Rhodoferax sp.]MBP9906491.1 ATP-binding cassette domain-containing protein [Rhodoferax sp.]